MHTKQRKLGKKDSRRGRIVNQGINELLFKKFEISDEAQKAKHSTGLAWSAFIYLKVVAR